ncbi:MAG TPA: hypothetical protein VIO60_03420 [Rectinemataceae bacterium]
MAKSFGKRAALGVLLLSTFVYGLQAQAPVPGSPPDPAKPLDLEDLAPLYFDLLDFMRSASLGREFSTPQAERERVSGLLLENWLALDGPTQASLIAIAQKGRTARADFAALSEAARQAKMAEWRAIMLSPQWIYAPPPASRRYQAAGLSLSYPADWDLAEGSGFLFIAPSLDTTWEAVNSAFSSPPGILLAAFSNDSGGMDHLVLARKAASSYLPGLSELCAFGSQAGAIVVMEGRFPGQAEDKFAWLTLLPCGEYLVLGRMLGPVSRADELLPAFYLVFNSLSWTDPNRQPGAASAAFDMAWNKVSTAIVADIWRK